MPRLLIHFARYGPYHHARLQAAHEALAPLGWEVIGLETAGTDATYAWNETGGSTFGPKVITAFPGRVHEEITAKECRSVLYPLLDSLDPDAIAIAGWASPDALSCLSWCRKHDRRRIVMSETREADGKRVWWKELIKRYLISRFDGALVGGKSHRDYLVKLGMPADKIRFGYNVVDNDYFDTEAAKWRQQDTGTSQAHDPNIQYPISNIHSLYFLASNRFIERKNLARLIDAYALYLVRATTAGRALESPEGDMCSDTPILAHPTPLATSGPARRSSPTWDLVLLGDGELKPALIAQCHRLGLIVQETAPWEQSSISNLQSPISSANGTVFFPGFRQIEELPRFYAHAGCFVHPALEEPWGLVINEAMASGLPVLSGNNVGAAEELIDDGVNGWKFEATDMEEMARMMAEITDFNFPISDFSSASRRILEERMPTIAFGKSLALLLK